MDYATFDSLPAEKVRSLKGIVLIHGEEAFFRSQAVRRLKETLGAGEDIAFYHAGEAKLAEVLPELASPSLFGSRRIVVFDGADILFSGKAAASPPKDFETILGLDNLLVLVCEKAADSALLKLLNKKGTTVQCKPLKQGEVPAWIMRHVQSAYGKRIETAAAKLLADLCGTALTVIDTHLRNLDAFTAKRATITAQDVEELVTDSRERKSYELGDAITAHDRGRALRLATELYESGIPLQQIFASLHRLLLRLWQAKVLLEQKATAADLIKALGLHPYVAQKMTAQLRTISLRSLGAKISLLQQADLDLKTSSRPDRLLLEELALRLCE